MDLFKVDISPTARRQLDRYVDYIQFTLLNDQAADAVIMARQSQCISILCEILRDLFFM